MPEQVQTFVEHIENDAVSMSGAAALHRLQSPKGKLEPSDASFARSKSTLIKLAKPLTKTADTTKKN